MWQENRGLAEVLGFRLHGATNTSHRCRRVIFSHSHRALPRSLAEVFSTSRQCLRAPSFPTQVWRLPTPARQTQTPGTRPASQLLRQLWGQGRPFWREITFVHPCLFPLQHRLVTLPLTARNTLTLRPLSPGVPLQLRRCWCLAYKLFSEGM